MRARGSEQGDRARSEVVGELPEPRCRQLLPASALRGRGAAGDQRFREGDLARSEIGRCLSLARCCIAQGEAHCGRAQGAGESRGAEPEPHLGETAVGQDSGAMTRARVAVFAGLAGLALLGFFQFPGHTWLQQDTQISAPMLERIWDPPALQHDIVASEPHLSYTVYDETAVALRWIARTSFHAVLQFEQIVFRVIELLGVYLLVLSFPLSRRMSTLATAFFGLGACISWPPVCPLW